MTGMERYRSFKCLKIIAIPCVNVNVFFKIFSENEALGERWLVSKSGSNRRNYNIQSVWALL